MKIKSCGIIPLLKENKKIKILLVQYNDRHWSFPKSRVKRNETGTEIASCEF